MLRLLEPIDRGIETGQEIGAVHIFTASRLKGFAVGQGGNICTSGPCFMTALFTPDYRLVHIKRLIHMYACYC